MNNSTTSSLPAAFVAEGQGRYRTHTVLSETDIIEAAKALLSQRFFRLTKITGSQCAKDFFISQLAGFDYEVFAVAFLDTKQGVIAFEPMFRGTINTTTVFPREVVKRALALNAAGVIFTHNHPSGIPEPSQSDIDTTRLLKKALELVDIQVLDHIVVGGTQTESFADTGLL